MDLIGREWGKGWLVPVHDASATSDFPLFF